MQQQNASQDASGRFRVSSPSSWDTDRWTTVVVIMCLAMLIMLRLGFRGVSVMGANVSVS